ncbi:HAMP domain-containing protein [Bdellovibrio sp. SKB1291214]|uniref:HAMP domain-containing protein n=1 Tax=Bdellovibrio sp. SKB1291214 TaxID=1732569 RepID=UPI000B51D17A|nr:HAMP domain-containing protein [Bdellovibrio sp. SKB1291214]UYL08504.1 HAMP domain-containing protein [Bdellovibrio sp. SKB1291214]
MAIFKHRRKLIVNREVQYDALMFVGLFVTGIFVAQVIAGWVLISKLEDKAAAGEYGSMSIAEFIARHKVMFLMNEFVVVIGCLILGFYLTNRVTSRIVGPLFNIRRILNRASRQEEAAEPVQIRLREDDYFQDLAKDLNVALQKKTK